MKAAPVHAIIPMLSSAASSVSIAKAVANIGVVAYITCTTRHIEHQNM
jgi:hypothetical protein